MRTIAALSLLLLPLSAQARHGFYGENGSGQPVTTGEAAQILEETTGEQQARAVAAQADERAAAPVPDAAVAAQAEAVGHGRVGGFIMVDPATARRRERDRLSDAVAQPRPTPDSARRYALWNAVGKPVQITPAKISQTDPEQAAPAAEREFERRMLGADKTYHAQPAPQPLSRAIVPAPGQLFVAVDLALAPREPLKDAVASFSEKTGFVADPRFAVASGTLDASRASLRGWLPSDRLAQAIQAPGVMRIEVDHGGPQSLGAGAARSSIVVGLRIPPDGDAAAAFQRVLGDLRRAADFRWTRTIGFQTLPDSREVALVIVGEVPVTRIPKVLEHPSVLKIAPAPPPAADAPAPKPSDAWPGFWTYARRRAPLLLTFTALFLLPQVGELAMRLLRAFVPYSRR